MDYNYLVNEVIFGQYQNIFCSRVTQHVWVLLGVDRQNHTKGVKFYYFKNPYPAEPKEAIEIIVFANNGRVFHAMSLSDEERKKKVEIIVYDLRKVDSIVMSANNSESGGYDKELKIYFENGSEIVLRSDDVNDSYKDIVDSEINKIAKFICEI